jgi:hypothetical protein
MTVAFVVLALFPRSRSLAGGHGTAGDLPALAQRTQGWLEVQRSRLPTKTQAAVDLLAIRLEELSPLLDTLNENDPVAHELRKLLGDHLPSLIDSYTSIPTTLTHQPHAGSTPAAQLHAGIATVAREVENIGKALASGELDSLAIRGRFLDTRYDPPRFGDED